MRITAQNIADLLGGTIEGDSNVVVNDLSKIEEGRPGTLTFLSNPAYTEYIYSTLASLAIVQADFKPEKPLPVGLTLIRVADSRLAFSKLLEVYAQSNKPAPGIHPSASVSLSAIIAATAFVGPMVVIEDGAVVGDHAEIHAHGFIGQSANVGSGTILHPRVNVGARCIVGNYCILQSGAVLGSDGFGFAPNAENQYQKVVHVGNVVVEDYVEIGANTTIDRATLGSTFIRKGVKLDNLIQVAHNVEIGENTVIAAQSGIAGSTKIGKNCMIGGQVGIIGHLTIADEVKIAAQSGIGHSITQVGSVVQGSPAMPIREFRKSYVHFRNLSQIVERIDTLAKNTQTENNG